jgi:hypothetical protein
MIIKDSMDSDLLKLSRRLNSIKIEGLFILSIDMKGSDELNSLSINEPSVVHYVEMGIQKFAEILDDPSRNFIDYNKDTLYILRNGNYADIKSVLTGIQGNKVIVGRGGPQKSHIVSPIELRMSSYLLALSNFNYQYLSYLNDFNQLVKSRYLPFFFKDKYLPFSSKDDYEK